MAIAIPAPERAAGRRRLAKKKQALSDGSFPIPNVAYLEKAIRAVGRAAPGKRPALAALIRKRARQLGSAGMAKLKGSWADNTQSTKAMANALYGQLIELGFSPEQAKAETQTTMTFMVREFAGVIPVVGSTDGPQVTTLVGGGSGHKLLSKASVHFRESTSSKRRCGTCSNFRGDHCSIVAGKVDAGDLCDRYSAKSGEYANASAETSVSLAKKFDPDNDGDDDASPSGNTDKDYSGKLNPVQRAAMKRMIAKGMSPAQAYKLACNVGGMKKAA